MVASLAMMTHSRPSIRPMPLMSPAPCIASSYMPFAASGDSSRNGVPESISRSARSRGNSLPRAVWRSRARTGPPSAASARRRFNSSTNSRICAALVRNSRLLVSIGESRIAMGSSDSRKPALARRLTQIASKRSAGVPPALFNKERAGGTKVGLARLWHFKMSKSATADFDRALPALPSLLDQWPHQPIQRGLPLKSDAGSVRQSDEAVLDLGIVGKAAECPEHARIGFGAAEAEAGRDRERHLVAAMGKQVGAAPVLRFQHGDGFSVLHDAIGMGRVDLDKIVVHPQAAEPHQVLYVFGRKKVLAGRQRRVIDCGDFRIERVMER